MSIVWAAIGVWAILCVAYAAGWWRRRRDRAIGCLYRDGWAPYDQERKRG